MSSVGKAKEHEKWNRLREENKGKPRPVEKVPSDDELKQRILYLLRNEPFPERDLRAALRISFVAALRLREVVSELEKSGRIEVREQGGMRTLYLTTKRE